MKFAATMDHREKTKESEKRNKYLDLGKELKKLWSMKVTVIPIVIGALGTIPKRLDDLEIRGRAEIIQTTASLKLAGMPR